MDSPSVIALRNQCRRSNLRGWSRGRLDHPGNVEVLRETFAVPIGYW